MKNVIGAFDFIETKTGMKAPLWVIQARRPERVTKEYLRERGYTPGQVDIWFRLAPIISRVELGRLAQRLHESPGDLYIISLLREYRDIERLNKKYSLENLTKEILEKEGIPVVRAEIFGLLPAKERVENLKVILNGSTFDLLEMLHRENILDKVTDRMLLGIGIPEDRVKVYNILKRKYGEPATEVLYPSNLLGILYNLGEDYSEELGQYLDPTQADKWKAVSGSRIQTIQIGRKQRRGRGHLGTYEELKSKIPSSVSRKNVEAVAEKYGISWTKMLIYNVMQGSRLAVAFALLGKDREGREFMYDRRETSSPGAGQTELHSAYGKVKVSSALRGDKEKYINALFPKGKE